MNIVEDCVRLCLLLRLALLGHQVHIVSDIPLYTCSGYLLLFHVQAEKTALLKAETKERTLKTFLLSQKHVVYTEPLDVQAGSTITVFYNPTNTVLNGKPEIWLRCSFNRWTHRMGLLPTQKMIPVENGSHLKATGEIETCTNISLSIYHSCLLDRDSFGHKVHV